MKHYALLLPLALAVTACSPEAEEPVADETTVATAEPAALEPAATPEPAASADANTLTLAGLGDLRIGEPVPAGSSFASRGAQIPGTTCRTVSSPDFPGVHAMTVDDEVRRITLSDESEVALVEGIGVGATEAEVRAAFPGFEESPHQYLAAPGKYLTQPGEDPRLHFEIAADETVSLIHVGALPELIWVEGCA
ncbi:hypothetical protein A9995_13930 [Erythrobacter sp. QSSC1-22B]|uniref:hypothetical protein n=1 Tax=Erythrobacter sp. QSSC1-22B TaxID=1860125 RepID=UPI0008057561|nr:hypothetical protein [Erythrobacter sp. QSSC1-22B]OBX18033.1 hypothetical protein A9995_13930 [Erythrobacter sp. QSSC1-22B]